MEQESHTNRASWANRQFTIPPKEYMDNQNNKLLTPPPQSIPEEHEGDDDAVDESSSNNKEEEQRVSNPVNLKTIQEAFGITNEPYPILAFEGSKTSSSLLSTVVGKSKKNNLKLSASLEFGPTTLPSIPPLSSSPSSSSSSPRDSPPSSIALTPSRSQRALIKLQGLFSSDGITIAPTSSATPLLSSSSESFQSSFFKKLSTKFNSSQNIPQTNQGHDFRAGLL